MATGENGLFTSGIWTIEDDGWSKDESEKEDEGYIPSGDSSSGDEQSSKGEGDKVDEGIIPSGDSSSGDDGFSKDKSCGLLSSGDLQDADKWGNDSAHYEAYIPSGDLLDADKWGYNPAHFEASGNLQDAAKDNSPNFNGEDEYAHELNANEGSEHKGCVV